jgi:transposase
MDETTEQLEALSSLLDLEELQVVHVTQDRSRRLRELTVTPRQPVALCPHCHQLSQERHLCHDRQVLDLPLGAYATHLIVRLFQYHCRACDKFFTPRLAALAEGAHATERFLNRVAELLKHTDLSNAAAWVGVPQKTLEHWYYDYLQRQQRSQENLLPIRRLGIDELSLKKDTASSASW